MLKTFLDKFFKQSGAYNDLESMLLSTKEHDKFSNLLPYGAYNDEEKYYLSRDERLCFIFEVLPLAYASKSTYDAMQTILDTVPFGTIIQSILYADDDISEYTESYMKIREGNSEEYLTIAQKAVDLYSDAAVNGFPKISSIPARNFRTFICLKMNTSELTDDVKFLRDSVFETLKGASIYPKYLPPQNLCELLQRIFNDAVDMPKLGVWKYNDEIPINKQIIMGGTTTNICNDHIKLGNDRWVTLQTIKEYPRDTLDELTINQVFGGIWGSKDDSNQYNFPFLCSVIFYVEDMKTKIHAQTTTSMFQQKSGSGAAHKKEREDELIWAAKEVDRNNRFIRVIPIIAAFAKNEDDAQENKARIKRMWEKQGFTVNNDKNILGVLFLMALPMGFYSTKRLVEFLERDRIMTSSSAARFFNIQGDYGGVGRPITLLAGRKGQVVTIDIFDRNLPSQNGIIAAGTGSGKSYFANRLLMDQRTSGSILRVFDLGGSYKKLCSLLGGNYLEFKKDSTICLNPFTFIKNIEEGFHALENIICQMIWSSSGHKPTETQSSIVKAANRRVWEDYGNDGSVDHVRDVLSDVNMLLKNSGSNLGETQSQSLGDIGRELAFNMHDFCKGGAYGRWFDGRCTLDIESDEFVVLELEELRAQPELFNVVMIQIINYVTENLYLSNREQPRIHLFDEAWQWADEGSMIGVTIERGYRLARKYYGSFITVFQSLLDLKKFGKSADVMIENSAWLFLLMGKNYEKVQEEGFLTLNDFEMEILKSAKLVKGKYSEVFIKTIFNSGIARLPNDLYSHLISTSDPVDNKMISDVAIQLRITQLEAIKHISEQQAIH